MTKSESDRIAEHLLSMIAAVGDLSEGLKHMKYHALLGQLNASIAEIGKIIECKEVDRD